MTRILSQSWYFHLGLGHVGVFLLFSFFLNIFFKGGLNAKAMKNCLEMHKKRNADGFKIAICFAYLLYFSRRRWFRPKNSTVGICVTVCGPLDCPYRMVDEAIQLSPDHIWPQLSSLRAPHWPPWMLLPQDSAQAISSARNTLPQVTTELASLLLQVFLICPTIEAFTDYLILLIYFCDF